MLTGKQIRISLGLFIAAGSLAVIFLRNTPHSAESVESAASNNTAFRTPMAAEIPSRENVSSEFLRQVTLLEQSVKNAPGNVTHLSALARLLMDGHRNTEAIKYFEKAAALRPEDDSLLFDLSVCYFNEREFSKAMAVTDRILSRLPDDSRALYNKGAIFAAANDHKEAIRSWKRLIRLHPESGDARTARSNIAQLESK